MRARGEARGLEHGGALALTDSSEAVRVAGAEEAFHLAPLSKDAEALIESALGDRTPRVRCLAAGTLALSHDGGGDGWKHLDGCLCDAEFVTREAAVGSLAKLAWEVPSTTRATASGGREGVQPLVDALRNSLVDVRAHAASALGQMGSIAQGATSALADALRDENRNVREEAARALLRMGSGTTEADPALQMATKDTDPAVACLAAGALVRLGASLTDEQAPILRALGHPERLVRATAEGTIFWLGPLAGPIVSHLVDFLGGESRDEVLHLLGRLRGVARAALPQVRALVSAEGPITRHRAAVALVRLGEASPAVPHLIEALGYLDIDVGDDVSDALREAGETAVRPLMEVLASPNSDLQATAAGILGSMGELGRPAVSLLRRLARDPAEQTARAARRALDLLR